MNDILQNQNFRYVSVLIVGLLIGILLMSTFFGSDHEGHDHGNNQQAHSESADAGTDDAEETIWTCSMHPQIRQNELGSCPLCGMDLTPASSSGGGDEFTLAMTAEAIALSQIMTSPVVSEVPVREISLPGRVVVDETRISVISAHYDGRIITQPVAQVGAEVRRGDVLVTVWSPDLIAAQQELIDAVRFTESNAERSATNDFGSSNSRILESSRQKLRFWGLTESQIAEIESQKEVRNEVEIRSPRSGVVLERSVKTDDYVSRGTRMYEIADLSGVWIDFESYEQDVRWLQQGDVVQYSAAAHPGETFAGRVKWVDVVVNEGTRTVRVRVDADNDSGVWKPGMLVRGRVLSEGRNADSAVMVPSTAVLWTGERSLVYVEVADSDVPTFESREVLLGDRLGDKWIVREGLEVGERVVSNGVFSVDAEFQLRDKVSMMNRGRGSAAPQGGRASAEVRDGVSASFRSEFMNMLSVYMQAKDALVDSDAAQALAFASNLRTRVSELSEAGLSNEAQTVWLSQRESLRRNLLNWSRSSDIEEQRVHFFQVSQQLIEVSKSFGVEGVVYQQYCPMAFNDTGAAWLSMESQIRNPFLPETMLGCGDIITEIN
ncbi:MAG: efflux RND transporter periplasmic adaptor subunit [Balneolales bacterium]|nr:efflux RND transporter periplasmic adaptor subunit [Balneolales bacterium]